MSEADMAAEELIAPVTEMPGTEANVALNRRTATNALAAIATEVSGKIATLAYFIAAARTLSKPDFGAFAYALSFGLLVATLPGFGFDPLLVQRGSAEPHRLRTLLSETLVWRTAIAVPVFLAAGIGGAILRPTPRTAAALLIVTAACIFDIFTEAARAAAQALQQQIALSKVLVLQRVVAAVLAIAALAAGLELIGLSVAYMLGSVVGMVGSFWSIRRLGLRVDLSSVRASGLKETVRLSIALGVDALVAMALFRVDQVMLAFLKGDAAVAAYAATYRLLETVLFITWSLSRAILPVMSASKEPWRVRRALEQGVGVLAILYVPFGVGLWVEAGPVIGKLFSAKYVASGIPVARWLAGSPLLFAIGFLGSYALLARRQRWRVLVASAVAAVFNVGLNLAIIPSLSGTGAAIATTASYALEAVVIFTMLVPVIGVPNFGRVLIVPTAASAVMAALLLWMHQTVWIEIPFGVVVYGLAWLALVRWWTPDQFRAIRDAMPWRPLAASASRGNTDT
jgi:O-antigen/teichoic acid export membrane protein